MVCCCCYIGTLCRHIGGLLGLFWFAHRPTPERLLHGAVIPLRHSLIHLNEQFSPPRLTQWIVNRNYCVDTYSAFVCVAGVCVKCTQWTCENRVQISIANIFFFSTANTRQIETPTAQYSISIVTVIKSAIPKTFCQVSIVVIYCTYVTSYLF